MTIKDLYDSNMHLIYNMNISDNWASTDIKSSIDSRLLLQYASKKIDDTLSDLETDQIRSVICDLLISKSYELNGLYNTTTLQYNAIENYAMTETGSDTGVSHSSGTSSDKSTTYDSSSERVTDSNDTASDVDTTTTHSLTRSGNIGVTTSQQMLQSERDIVKFDFIAYVCDLINDNICSCFWGE